MSLNNTPSAERLHIAFFGRRNAGKSSVINAVCGQELSIVSDVKGTTTDPVQKAMEILPLGPVVIIDTPGLDDEGALGKLRMEKSYQVMRKTDIGVLVVDSEVGITEVEEDIIVHLAERNIPYIIAWNKNDLCQVNKELQPNEIAISAVDKSNIYELKELIGHLVSDAKPKGRIIGDLIEKDDFIVLVIPIDSAAPKGRLILPQQQTIRDILDSHANAVVVQDSELEATLAKMGDLAKLVVTDSQAFEHVQKIVPKHIPLTSFSILFARYKGDLRQTVEGAAQLDQLEDGDKVLICEGCTHHRQCDDIGTIKLPRWIGAYTKKNIEFDWTSGVEFRDDLSQYKLVIHCGACMLNDREVQYRLNTAKISHVPMANYGIAIAKMNGILDRSLEIFGDRY